MFLKAIHSNNAPKAIGPYSPAVKLGDFVYLSGQIPVDPATNELAGDDITTQTHQVFKNIQAVLAEMGLQTYHIVKTTVFITDMNEFSAMNEVYSQYVSEPYPARSTVQVCALPKGSKVEIECIVIDTLAYEAQAQASSGCSGCDGGCGESDCEEGCCCG